MGWDRITYLYERRKFTVLLLALVSLLIVRPLIAFNSAYSEIHDVLVTAVFLAASSFLYLRRSSRWAAIALGLPTILGVLAHKTLESTPPLFAGLTLHIFPVLFIAYTLVAILWSIFRVGEVSYDSIHGAFCGYLLLGLAYGHLYCLTELWQPGSFALPAGEGPMPPVGERRLSLLTYFSLVTLTTVGYGDITPRGYEARTLAWVEAMMGQFYIAVILAELIGLKLSAAIRDERREPQANSEEKNRPPLVDPPR